MKALIVPVLGDPVVLDGGWDDPAVIRVVLDSKGFEAMKIPSTPGSPALMLFSDEDAKYKRLDVNRTITTLVADRLRVGDYVAGPVLITGYDRKTGSSVSLDLLDLVRIGARLVRAERAALRSTQPEGKTE